MNIAKETLATLAEKVKAIMLFTDSLTGGAIR
jgi:hypothetical protein